MSRSTKSAAALRTRFGGLPRRRSQNIEQIPLPAPSPELSSGVVDDKHLLYVQTGGERKGTKFLAGKNVARRCAGYFPNMPCNRHIAVLLIPGHLVANPSQGRSHRSIEARI